MHPYLFDIPLPGERTIRVPSYGFMILCGFLVCLWLVRRRGRRMGLDPVAVFDLVIVTLISGIVGARLFYVVDNWEFFRDELWQIPSIWKGGLVFHGGLMGGAAGLLASIWKKKLPLRTALDVVTSLIPLGHAFGRTGCFLNGCCFGKVTAAWTGIRFPRVLDAAGGIVRGNPFAHHFESGLVNAAQHWSLPVHPTQLYAVGYNLAIFAVLSYLLRRRWRAGEVAWFYGMFYGTARFVNEFFRVTERVPELGGLTVFQAISFAMVIIGFVMFLDGRRRPYQPLPEPWRPPPEQQRRRA